MILEPFKKKTWAIHVGHAFFQKLKKLITPKYFVRISSNFLHSVKTSENVMKTGGGFGAIFWKKPWAIYSPCFFQNLLVS